MLYAISILAIIIMAGLCFWGLCHGGKVREDRANKRSDTLELNEFAVTPHDSDGEGSPTALPNLINPAEVCEIPLADDCGGARLRIGTAASVSSFHTQPNNSERKRNLV